MQCLIQRLRVIITQSYLQIKRARAFDFELRKDVLTLEFALCNS